MTSYPVRPRIVSNWTLMIDGGDTPWLSHSLKMLAPYPDRSARSSGTPCCLPPKPKSPAKMASTDDEPSDVSPSTCVP